MREVDEAENWWETRRASSREWIASVKASWLIRLINKRVGNISIPEDEAESWLETRRAPSKEWQAPIKASWRRRNLGVLKVPSIAKVEGTESYFETRRAQNGVWKTSVNNGWHRNKLADEIKWLKSIDEVDGTENRTTWRGEWKTSIKRRKMAAEGEDILSIRSRDLITSIEANWHGKWNREGKNAGRMRIDSFVEFEEV